MRILTLTPQIETSLARRREGEDRQAHQVAARIVASVRQRGDAALDGWTRKLDGVDVPGKLLWVTPPGN